MRNSYKILLTSFVFFLVFYANVGEANSTGLSNESEITLLIQKINSLSKKNEQLKNRINLEINKQNDIITKILKLTNTVDLRFANDTLMNRDDVVTVDDFNYVDDSLLRKCNGITRDYYNKEDLLERTSIKNLYDTEDIDLEWTTEVSDGINEHLTERFPKTEVVSIQCKTSICEINLKHDDEVARKDFEMNFNPENKWNIVDSQSENDIVTGGSFISIQIARDGKILSTN